MWVRFGRDDRAKPQEYSKYFEDFATKERSKMARSWDARTGVILSRALGHYCGLTVTVLSSRRKALKRSVT